MNGNLDLIQFWTWQLDRNVANQQLKKKKSNMNIVNKQFINQRLEFVFQQIKQSIKSKHENFT